MWQHVFARDLPAMVWPRSTVANRHRNPAHRRPRPRPRPRRRGPRIEDDDEDEPLPGSTDWLPATGAPLPVDVLRPAPFTGLVRAFVAILLAAWVGSGCSTGGPGARPTPPGSATGPDPAEGVNRLDERVQGKVVEANARLRYVVMDFPLRRMPALEQRLNVYRDGQKVGEVKVSGPVRDTTVAGDVMVGEAREGDEVRED